MKQVTLHGEPIKVGDEVWEIKRGKTIVTHIDVGENESLYPIHTSSSEEYTKEGKFYYTDEAPSLFWKKQKFDLSKPKTKN